ncbi:MAG: potassium-transporting ATPase subunit KdpC [Chlorobium limicola]|nr:potassium-transporting ATPase subunit KdpC [Chlorobium limicola]
MKNKILEALGLNLAISLRIALVTIVFCGGLYPLAIWGVARLVVPEFASGSLVRDQSGQVVGSRLIAQAFSKPGYFWPRPSAVNYDASAAGGSNLSPAGPEVRARAQKTLAAYHSSAAQALPADLAAASGSGLDPYITLEAALYQAPRVAKARGVNLSDLEVSIRRHASGNRLFWSGEGLVNVMELNMYLDAVRRGGTINRP